MQMQSQGNSQYLRLGPIQNLPTPHLSNLFQEERNGCGLRALHDWHNAPRVETMRQMIRHRIAMILRSLHYYDWSPLSVYLENLLLWEAASEAEYMDLDSLNHRLQSVCWIMVTDPNAVKDFQSFSYDLSYGHLNSTGNGLNYEATTSYSTAHDPFSNYINQTGGDGSYESLSHSIKRRLHGDLSINCDSSSECLDDIWMPLKRARLETSLFSCPWTVQPSASQTSPEWLPQQDNSFVILNDEVSGIERRASAIFTRASTGTYEVENNRSDDCLSMNANATQGPYDNFIIDEDFGQIDPRRFYETWENVETGSEFNMESQINNGLRLGMKEDSKNNISLRDWLGNERNSDGVSVPSQEFNINNNLLKMECPQRTCETWESVDEGNICFDSFNFNHIDVDMAETGFNLEMPENWNNCSELESDHGKEHCYETMQAPPVAVVVDKDPMKSGYSTRTCKTWGNIEDPIRNELELGNLNNSTALEADHGKGQTSFFLFEEKTKNSETNLVPPKAVINQEDPLKIRYSSTSTGHKWVNVEDRTRNEFKWRNLNNSAALETDHGKRQASFLFIRDEEQDYENITVPAADVIIDRDPMVASQDEGKDVEDSTGNEQEVEKFNSCTAVEADHKKEQNYVVDEDSQKIMCSTISFNESMEVKDEMGNKMHEDLNKYSDPIVDHDEIQNAEKTKLSGVSLVEFFTEDEVRRHISSLKPTDFLAARDSTGNIHFNGCDLCWNDKLYFTPLPLYCFNCATRIKYQGHYFSSPKENNPTHYLCLSCHKLAVRKKGNLLQITMEAKDMCKKKNDEEAEEPWVQCDKCERWQHQICALFNYNKDLEGKAGYTCPKCLLKDFQLCERSQLKSRLVAKDLPTTMLSDHIENRLYWSLKKERKLRAELAGKTIEEVEGVEGLVVRVVSSVEKQLKMKKNFSDIFKNQSYPTEFPYRSKALVVFQNTEGVDVFIFAMYIQEFGLECGPQNQRCVYISYLDSVKYFTPDTKSATGEALRSFVYHEVMIASLDFFKKRGFASCHIWSCPPPNGEDYIFYCHPKNQKVPKSDKLRKWYLLMLKKAAKERIVVNATNLYDHFFVTSEESNLKVTATRLPYFEGDYWTAAAEHIIESLEKDKDGGSNIKGNKQVTKRTLRALGHGHVSNSSTDDILLMQKLGENILPSKEDFMIVQLQFFCTHCDEAILSGKRWFCRNCPNFHLCERCYSTTRRGPYRLDTHTAIDMQKHKLDQVKVDIPFIKDDEDVVMENNLFDDRLSFLEYCQKKRYQFDTLRGAKYSSMMILNDLQKNLATVGNEIGLTHLLRVTQHHIKRRDPGQSNTPHSLQMRKIVQHWSSCKIRAAKGCNTCRKALTLLKTHSRMCQNSECSLPS